MVANHRKQEPEPRPARRAVITGSTIRGIIANPVFRGIVRVRNFSWNTAPSVLPLDEWQEFKGRHVALVSEETWFRANRLLRAVSASPDRYPEQPMNGGSSRDVFARKNVDAVVHSCPLSDEPPPGLTMGQIIDAIARLESRCFRQRINAGLKVAAERGFWKGGRPSFGYRYCREGRILVPHEEEAPIVKHMFEQIAAGVSIAGLVLQLRGKHLYGRKSTRSGSGT